MADTLTSDPLAALIPIIAACGVLTLTIATFLERLIPVIPSHLLLVVIGVTSAQGSLSLPTALAFSLIGSVLGCLPLYLAGRAVGERRSRRFIEETAHLIGISSEKYRRWEDRFRSNEQSISFIAQLVPTVRIMAPAIAGLLRTGFWQFVGATTLGVMLWDGLFIVVGYISALINRDTNTSVLALKTVIALSVTEGLAFLGWRWKAWPR